MKTRDDVLAEVIDERDAAVREHDAAIRARDEARKAMTRLHRRTQEAERYVRVIMGEGLSAINAERLRTENARHRGDFWQGHYRAGVAQIVASGTSDHCGDDLNSVARMRRLDVLISRLIAERDEARAKVASLEAERGRVGGWIAQANRVAAKCAEIVKGWKGKKP